MGKRLHWPGWKPWRRPVWMGRRALLASRYSPRTWRPRRRTSFTRGMGVWYLLRSRCLRRRAAALGFLKLKPGLFYDPRADIFYVELSGRLVKTDNITRGA